jgi:hypothetical protein
VVILGAVAGLAWYERSSGKSETGHLPLPLNLRDPKIFEMLPSPSLICHPAVSSHSQTWVFTNAGHPPAWRLP